MFAKIVCFAVVAVLVVQALPPLDRGTEPEEGSHPGLEVHGRSTRAKRGLLPPVVDDVVKSVGDGVANIGRSIPFLNGNNDQSPDVGESTMPKNPKRRLAAPKFSPEMVEKLKEDGTIPADS